MRSLLPHVAAAALLTGCTETPSSFPPCILAPCAEDAGLDGSSDSDALGGSADGAPLDRDDAFEGRTDDAPLDRGDALDTSSDAGLDASTDGDALDAGPERGGGG